MCPDPLRRPQIAWALHLSFIASQYTPSLYISSLPTPLSMHMSSTYVGGVGCNPLTVVYLGELGMPDL